MALQQPCLFIHHDAHQDLELLWDSHEEVAARITVLLEQLQADNDLLDRLTQDGYYSQQSGVDISSWKFQQKQGNNLWRLKVLDLERLGLRWRIIYAFIPLKQYYYVLGIVPRRFDYAEQHPLTQRMLGAYRDL